MNEYREPSEMERDVAAFSAQYLDDLGLELDSSVVWLGGEEVILTTSAQPQYGEREYYRPGVMHGTVSAWREWVETEYAPSFY